MIIVNWELAKLLQLIKVSCYQLAELIGTHLFILETQQQHFLHEREPCLL